MSHYLSDYVLGGLDGSVTAFSMIASASGADLSAETMMLIGFAGLISKGVTTAISNYLATETQNEQKINLDKTPMTAAIITLMGFILMGLIPFLVYLVASPFQISDNLLFPIASILSLLSLYIIGVLKAIITGQSILETSFKVTLTGVLAGGFSYLIGYLLPFVISTSQAGKGLQNVTDEVIKNATLQTTKGLQSMTTKVVKHAT